MWFESVVKAIPILGKIVDWRLKQNEIKKEKIDRLKEMLRNPEHQFRTTDEMARAINDDTYNHKITNRYLKKYVPEARHNIKPGGLDSWTIDDNWEWDVKGNKKEIRMNPDSTYVLKKGLPPGRF